MLVGGGTVGGSEARGDTAFQGESGARQRDAAGDAGVPRVAGLLKVSVHCDDRPHPLRAGASGRGDAERKELREVRHRVRQISGYSVERVCRAPTIHGVEKKFN